MSATTDQHHDDVTGVSINTSVSDTTDQHHDDVTGVSINTSVSATTDQHHDDVTGVSINTSVSATTDQQELSQGRQVHVQAVSPQRSCMTLRWCSVTATCRTRRGSSADLRHCPCTATEWRLLLASVRSGGRRASRRPEAFTQRTMIKTTMSIMTQDEE